MPATKSRRSSKFGSYTAVKDICDRPIAKRRELAIGRGGTKRKPRKFHNSVAEIDQLRAEYKETGGDNVKLLPNPYNRGSYHYIVEALKRLGPDERFRFATVAKKVKDLMSDPETTKDGKTAWQRFDGKDSRNEETGRDADGRLMQNVNVLQRVNPNTSFSPYGLKLLEVGTRVLKTKGVVIDVLKGNGGEVMLRLNTDSAKPINEMKTRGQADEKAEKAPKTRKARKTAKADAVVPAAVPAAEAPVAEVPATVEAPAATVEATPEVKADEAAAL